MNDSPEKKIILPSPERKREYIQRWLEDNLHAYAHFSTDSSEQVLTHSPDLDKQSKAFVLPVSPALSQKRLLSCTPPSSPVLGGKRLASSPVIGRRKVSRRIKVAKKLNIINAEETKNSNVILQSTEKCKTETEVHDRQNFIFKKNFHVSLSETAETSLFDKTFDSSKTVKCNISIKENMLLKNVNTEIFSDISKISEPVASQVIESISSEDVSIRNTEINVQECNTDTDKTASDLIEEMSVQMALHSPTKQNRLPLSQNISSPSSTTSEPINGNCMSESIATGMNINHQSLETFTPTDPIESVSTLDSKIDSSRTCYILQHVTQKQTRKRNFKKGNLLDTLLTTMGKEKSNVNLLRHQLCRKLTSVIEKPFILLQILQYLPMINDNQLLKCILLEDAMNLLNDLLKNKNHRFITIMNVPEVSCVINETQKPILKVYEPWTILDPNQLFLQITRFIAIPTTDVKDYHDIINKRRCNENLKPTHEFHCPCINERMLSDKCGSKFRDAPHNLVKMIFNYK